MRFPIPNPMIKEVVLERVHFYCQESIDEMVLHDMKVEFAMPALDMAVRRMVLSMRCYVWGEDVGKHVVSYPENWWEAFKGRWFSQRMLRRWPVKMKHVKFDVKAVYPTLNYSMPDNNPRLILIRNTEPLLGAAKW